MPRYTYVARTVDGSRVAGEFNASSMRELMTVLRARGEFLVGAREASHTPPAAERWRLRFVAGPRNIAVLASQMAAMLSAGLSLHDTLELMADQARHPALAKMLRAVAEEIEAGGTLSGAFGRYREALGRMFMSVLRAGEGSGNLDVALERLAERFENQADLEGEVKGAMVYPLILVVMTALVSGFLVTFILPRFVEQFEIMRVPVPTVTRILLDLSVFMSAKGAYVALGGVLSIVALHLAFRTDAVRWWWDGVALRIPRFGSIARRRSAAMFSHTFCLLQDSGTPLLENLDLCADVVGNRRIAAQIREARARIENGQTLGEALARASLLPRDLIRMFAIGERTGKLTQMVGRLGRLYDGEIQRETKALVTLVEPLLLVVMGGIVGFVALALLIPMIRATKSIQGR